MTGQIVTPPVQKIIT